MFFKTENLTKEYIGLVANSNINIEVNQGQIVGIIGPNGAGKSTFFQMIQGFLVPTSGKVFFCDENITRKQPNQISKLGIASTFQHAQLFPNLSVLESIMIGSYNHTNSKKNAKMEALELMGFMELIDFQDYNIKSLNMFIRKKVELTAALASKPKLLLLDELFAGLNTSEVNEMVKTIKKVYEEKEISIIIIEHVLKAINDLCEKIYVFNYGKIIAECEPGELSTNKEVLAAYLGE